MSATDRTNAGQGAHSAQAQPVGHVAHVAHVAPDARSAHGLLVANGARDAHVAHVAAVPRDADDAPAAPAVAVPAWQQEWTQQYAAPLPQKVARGRLSLLRFVLGRESFALAVHDIAAATDAAPAVALPGRRERLVWGLFHHDGQLLLAADLRRLLRPAERPAGAPAPRDAFARVLLIGQGGASFAVAVDHVPGSVRVAPEQVLPVPVTMPAAVAALARGVLRHDGGMTTVLDGARLLATLSRDLT